MDDSHDQERFAAWFMRSQRELYGYILAVVPNLDEADEIFQEAGLVLWKKQEQLESYEHFLRFAFGVARNCIRSYLSKKGRDRHVFGDDFIEKLAAANSGESDWFERQTAALSQCLQKLSDKQRGLVQKFYAAEQSTTALAEEQGLTENALYQRLHRIRRGLFDCVSRLLAKEGS